MARQFIEQRGRTPFFALSICARIPVPAGAAKFIQQKKAGVPGRASRISSHTSSHPTTPPKNPGTRKLRWFASALSGKYFQQHAPVREQTVPVGHSVRFGYLETAVAMLARETGDRSLLPALERAWEHMVDAAHVRHRGHRCAAGAGRLRQRLRTRSRERLCRDLRRTRQPVLELGDGGA